MHEVSNSYATRNMFPFKDTRSSKEDTFSQRKEYTMSEVRNVTYIYRAHLSYRFNWIKKSALLT